MNKKYFFILLFSIVILEIGMERSAFAGRKDIAVDLFAVDLQNVPLSGVHNITYCIASTATERTCLVEQSHSATFEEGVYQTLVNFESLDPSTLTDTAYLWIDIDGDAFQPMELATTLWSISSQLSDHSLQADVADVAMTVASTHLGAGLSSSGGIIGIDNTVIPQLASANQWANQQLFSKNPADASVASATVRINPTADPTEMLLAVQNNNSSKMTVDAEGNVMIAGNLTLGGTFQGELLDGEVSNNLNLDGGTINNSPIGSITPSTGQFTQLTIHGAAPDALTLLPYGAGAGQTSEIRFYELNANGPQYLAFKAPDSLTANQVWTLPAADGANGQILSTDGSGALSWITVAGTGTITGVTAGTGLLGGGSSGVVTLDVDTGTTADKIVQLDSSARIPAVDGSLLTGIVPENNTVTTSKIADGSITTSDISSSAGITDAQISDTLTASIFIGSGSSTNAVDLATAEASGILPLSKGGTGADLSATGGANQFVRQSTAGGNFSVSALSDADIPDDITINNSTMATALAANGINCSAGSYALGVDASGNAEGCTVASTATGTVTSVSSGTGLTGSFTTSGTLSFSYADSLSSNALTAGQSVFDSSDNSSNGGLLLEGATANGFEGLLTLADPSADRTWTLPNVSGTIVTTGDSGSVTATMIADGTITSADVDSGFNSPTSTSLAANGSNCSAGSYSLGVDAEGNAEGCTVASTASGTVTSISSGTGLSGSVTTTGSLSLSYADSLSSNSLTAGQAVFDSADNSSNGGLLLEGATANGFEGLLTLADPSADRTWTLPNVSGIIITTGDSGTVTSTMITDGTIASADVDSGFVAPKATALNANGTNCSAGNYALGVDASGNAEGCTTATTGTVTSVSSGTGLTGTVSTSGSLSLSYSDSLSSNSLTSGQLVLDSGDNSSNGGLLFEGATADAFEGLLSVVDPTADRSWILPNVSGTIVTSGDTGTVTSTMILNGTIATADIAAQAVTATEIADGTITTTDISASAAITDAQVNNNLTISGGTINNTPIGATTPSTGVFSSLTVGTGGTTITKLVSASATLDFPSRTLLGCDDLTITLTGAVVGDNIYLGTPNSCVLSGYFYFAWVSAADTVTVRACSLLGLLSNPPSASFKVSILQ